MTHARENLRFEKRGDGVARGARGGCDGRGRVAKRRDESEADRTRRRGDVVVAFRRSARRLRRLQLQSATRVRGSDGGRAVPGETRVGIERRDARAGRNRVGEVRRRRREGQRDAETVAGETGQTHTRRRRRRRRRRRSLRARGLDGDAKVGTRTDVLVLVFVLVLVQVQVFVLFVLQTSAEGFGVVPERFEKCPRAEKRRRLREGFRAKRRESTRTFRGGERRHPRRRETRTVAGITAERAGSYLEEHRARSPVFIFVVFVFVSFSLRLAFSRTFSRRRRFGDETRRRLGIFARDVLGGAKRWNFDAIQPVRFSPRGGVRRPRDASVLIASPRIRHRRFRRGDDAPRVPFDADAVRDVRRRAKRLRPSRAPIRLDVRRRETTRERLGVSFEGGARVGDGAVPRRDDARALRVDRRDVP